MANKNVYVTKPITPSKWRLFLYFTDILKSRVYTNDGKYLRRLESSLKTLWAVKYVVIMSNGTLPIICLLEMLGRGKKVLTTPFTFVATTNAIIASGNSPIFVDIERDSLLPSPDAIRSSLEAGDISAVLLTQVFGLIPDYQEIELICQSFGVPLFFDSSHSFGVETEEGSAYGLGNATTASFHATKNFSTVEGGAVVTDDPAIYEFAKSWRNFGIVNGEITRQGVNAKMHEFSAAFGLAVLPRMKSELARRRRLFAKIRNIVEIHPVIVIESPNASYFPVVFQSEEKMLKVKKRMEELNIFPRRYFYPSLDLLAEQLNLETQACPVSRSVADAILCLPMGSNVNRKVLRRIERAFDLNEW